MDIQEIKAIQTDSRWPHFLRLLGQAKALDMLSKMRTVEAKRKELAQRYQTASQVKQSTGGQNNWSEANPSEQRYFKGKATPVSLDPMWGDMRLKASVTPACRKSKSFHPFWGDLNIEE